MVFSEWSILTKSKGRKDDPEGRRQLFTDNFTKLWDVESLDAIELILANCFLFDEKNKSFLQ